jgi:hypothetical protein
MDRKEYKCASTVQVYDELIQEREYNAYNVFSGRNECILKKSPERIMFQIK